ncbi:hypothetical protein SMSRO_SF031000 [Spiroplasma poulsonii]|uniref:Plectrovirus-related protein n=1 Tax=Spiroplasma poulsonii TaxID=2138 RepID=A0A2P6F8C0_9MOLU|nr:hypothetical protein SMSRO_SF030760 [Spiroplasma poulsonii]PQM29687.1 hypothetical protein SMSRO_SF030880 [Spiroplasma poulsonii]PQM29699.1 hypothetical protein SMSRO_SF031000 [Spiroplasma poulsonii]
MSLYDYWVKFITYIIGSNAPEFLYTVSFVFFLILFFGVFIKVIFIIFRMICS